MTSMLIVATKTTVNPPKFHFGPPPERSGGVFFFLQHSHIL